MFDHDDAAKIYGIFLTCVFKTIFEKYAKHISPQSIDLKSNISSYSLEIPSLFLDDSMYKYTNEDYETIQIFENTADENIKKIIYSFLSSMQ